MTFYVFEIWFLVPMPIFRRAMTRAMRGISPAPLVPPGLLEQEMSAERYARIKKYGGALDLTPVDYVSGAIVELSMRPESIGQTYHLVNFMLKRTLRIEAATDERPSEREWLSGIERNDSVKYSARSDSAV